MAVYNYTEGIDRPRVEASQSSNSTIPFPKGEKVPSVEPSIWHRSPKERKYGKPKDKIEKKKMQLTSTTIIIERKTNGSRQNLNSSQELFSFSKIGRPRPFSFILGLSKRHKFYSKLMWKMSIQYPAPGFELTTFRLWVSSFKKTLRDLFSFVSIN